jgi:phosphatidylserine/phosphatidylglycerophosphate/cardiolipin synthase-like enzyme
LLHNTLETVGQEQPAAVRRPVLHPGRNCALIAHATRARVLVDGEDYYRNLADVLAKATRSILIVGWDFDGRIRLRPEDPHCLSLGEVLRDLVERNPELHVSILIWSVAVAHAPSKPNELLLTSEWARHPRISFRLDTAHPIYAAHHQKIVVVDENIAFAGGMDLTVNRWDSCDHLVRDPRRINESGEPYESVHDVQMMVEGEIAGALGDVVRDRWLRFAGEAPEARAASGDLWPPNAEADFTDLDIAIARTLPNWSEYPPVAEIAALTADAVQAARTLIYIENQYLTAPQLAKLLAKRLSQPTGPDVVIVVTRNSHGAMEEFVMGRNRVRFLRRLRKADKYGRLRVYCPVIRDGDDESMISVHSKLMIVDDVFLRVGSANLNNRSMGLDTECDIVIEGNDARIRKQICFLRERLLAEHLGTTPERVRQSLRAEHSMLRGVEKLNCEARCLHELTNVSKRGPVGPVFGTFLMDPVRPFFPAWVSRLRRRVPQLWGFVARRIARNSAIAKETRPKASGTK